MASLRMLCERYISIDDGLQKLNAAIDDCNAAERSGLVAEYLTMYMEREDFKSGMRRQLIYELVNGVGGDYKR